MEGALSNRLEADQEETVDLIALPRGRLDFAEDDISVAPDATVLKCIAEVKSSARRN